MPELSIIVPVYNVEDYIKECIDSLLLNDIPDMELLLVDDGSTDNSGQICDEYVQRDKRVIVLHKENGGLSSARNYGLDHAKGDYIGFVDSDDIVNKMMFSTMLNTAQRYHADIAICGIQYFTDSLIDTSPCVHSDVLIVSEDNSRYKLFISPQGMGDYAVNKIYKRELFATGIQFPEDHIFEDIFTSYKLFDKAKRVICLDKDYYYYRLRKGSISHGKKFNPKMVDIVYSTGEQLEFIRENAPEYLPLANQKYLDANVIEYKHLSENGKLFKERKLVKYVKKNITDLLNSDFVISRFRNEATQIRKGVFSWRFGLLVTKVYKKLHRRPKLQRIIEVMFKHYLFE